VFADSIAEDYKRVHPGASYRSGHNSSREVDDQTVIATLGQGILDDWREKRARRADIVTNGTRIRRPTRFAAQTNTAQSNAAQANTVQPNAAPTNTVQTNAGHATAVQTNTGHTNIEAQDYLYLYIGLPQSLAMIFIQRSLSLLFGTPLPNPNAAMNDGEAEDNSNQSVGPALPAAMRMSNVEAEPDWNEVIDPALLRADATMRGARN
jgi:hypothetical protein